MPHNNWCITDFSFNPSFCCCVNVQSILSTSSPLWSPSSVHLTFNSWQNLPEVCLYVITLQCTCLQLLLKLVWGLCTNISAVHCTRMIIYVMLFKADKLKYNGLSCLVSGWCNCPVCPKNWSDNRLHILAWRLLINGWPSAVFGVLDIHNLSLWLFGVDVEIAWHILVPTLEGSNSLSQVSGLTNGKWWHDD